MFQKGNSKKTQQFEYSHVNLAGPRRCNMWLCQLFGSCNKNMWVWFLQHVNPIASMNGIFTIIYLLPKLAGDHVFFQVPIRYEGCWPAFSMTRIGRFLSPHLGQREEMVALRLEVPPQLMDGSFFFFARENPCKIWKIFNGISTGLLLVDNCHNV